MEISLVITVKNEEATIDKLLTSLLSQSRKPDEIIIVDGGSTDKTVNIIQGYADQHPIVRLILAPGTNLAQARNIGIRAASCEIIAQTDAGCTLDKHWLANLAKELNSDVDVVSGVYNPDARSFFERCAAATVLFPDVEKIDPDRFLPSARSILFRKGAWETVGGHPEWLYTGDDTLFDLMLRRRGLTFRLAKDAIVYWRVRGSFRSLFKQLYLYAKGDGEAGIVSAYRCLQALLSGSLVLSLLWGAISRNFILLLMLMLAGLFSSLLVALKKASRTFRSNDVAKATIHCWLILVMNFVASSLGYLRGMTTLKYLKHRTWDYTKKNREYAT